MKMSKMNKNINLSSLPQGWHSLSDSKKSSANTSVTTIRKKWNSPLSSATPKSRLPSYKRPAPTPMLSNSCSNHPKSSTKISSTPQTRQPLYSAKPPTKDYPNEIVNLKKELTSVKAENSVLKVKVRRVDDENNQKSRQIEKLRTEIKSIQTGDSMSIKRNKESDSLLSLRQKCLRLEAALKEKDASLKKFMNDINNVKSEEVKALVESFQNEIKNDEVKENKPIHCNSSKSLTSSSARTSLSRVSLSSKSEVTKLRDMLHKLQNENRELQQHNKEKELEIRRLKMQFQRPMLKDVKKTPVTPVPNHKQILKSRNSEPKVKSLTPISAAITTKAVVIEKPVKAESALKLPKPNHVVPKTALRVKTPIKTVEKKDLAHKVADKGKSSTITPKLIPKSQVGSAIVESSKLPVTKASSTFVVTKVSTQPMNGTSAFIKDDLPLKAQEMRENVAARKIQRSWRSHQKRMLTNVKSPAKNEAAKFIITTLKHNKKRKEKLKLLSNKGGILHLNEEEKAAIEQTVRERHSSYFKSESKGTY